jgi:hypothetical protein
MLAYDHFQQGEYAQALELIDKSETYPEHLGSGAPAFPDYRNQNLLRAWIYNRTGEGDKARQADEWVQSYTERFGEMRGGNIFEREFSDTYVKPF